MEHRPFDGSASTVFGGFSLVIVGHSHAKQSQVQDKMHRTMVVLASGLTAHWTDEDASSQWKDETDVMLLSLRNGLFKSTGIRMGKHR